MPPSHHPATQPLRQDKQIQTQLRNIDLYFSTTWGLFSPKEIDEGSRLLLNYLNIEQDAHCLDLGCGYGVLGITMAKLAPQGEVLMVDKDFVAVDYANKNTKQNNIANAEAILSNGFDALNDQKFDVIVSNIPAKVGNEMLQLFTYDALSHLKANGQFYVVTINGLRQFIKRTFTEIFGNYNKLKQGKNYTVASTTKTE